MKKYSYRTIWSLEDGEYVGLCAEFPSLSWLADSPSDALAGIYDLVEKIVDDMDKSGEKLPDSFGEKDFSGKFMVRVPPEVHRDLSMKAAEQGVSLNRLISSRLASNSL